MSIVQFLLAILMLAAPAQVQDLGGPKASVYPVVSGSAPPVPGLFVCAEELKKKPYREELGQACLREILSSGYFESGSLQTQRSYDGSLVVSLLLKAPQLKVDQLDFGLDPQTDRQVREYLGQSVDTLQLGRAFLLEDEAMTSSGLQYFFLQRGHAVGISASYVFDYDRQIVQVHYHITQGPAVPSLSPPPPWGRECPRWIGIQNWLDVDDSVPLVALQRLTTLRGEYSCFSEHQIREDEEKIRSSGLVSGARIDVSGPIDHPDVSLHLIGKPLVIENVITEGFGLIYKDVSNATFPGLAPGSVYSRARVAEALRQLKAKYSQPGRRVEVFEDVELSIGSRLRLKLQILTFPGDQVVVLGRARLAKPFSLSGG